MIKKIIFSSIFLVAINIFAADQKMSKKLMDYEQKKFLSHVQNHNSLQKNIHYQVTDFLTAEIFYEKNKKGSITLLDDGNAIVNGHEVSSVLYPDEKVRAEFIKRIFKYPDNKNKTSLFKIIFLPETFASSVEDQDQVNALAQSVITFAEDWRKNNDKWFKSVKGLVSSKEGLDNISTQEYNAFIYLFRSMPNTYKVQINCQAPYSSDEEFVTTTPGYQKNGKLLNAPRFVEIVDSEGNTRSMQIQSVNTGNKAGFSINQADYIVSMQKNNSTTQKQFHLPPASEINYQQLSEDDRLIRATIACCNSYDESGKDCVMKVRDEINRTGKYRPTFQPYGTKAPLKGTR